MTDKIIKESYLLSAPFEEQKTEQSEQNGARVASRFPPPMLNI